MADAFWTDEVKAEFRDWIGPFGPKVGATMFWSMQETRDRYRLATKGIAVSEAEMTARHIQALAIDQMMEDGEYGAALFYENEVKAEWDWMQYTPPGTFDEMLRTNAKPEAVFAAEVIPF